MIDVEKQQNYTAPPPAKSDNQLPQIYEAYLIGHQQRLQVPLQHINRLRRFLTAFNQYLEKHKVALTSLKIEQIDAFMAEFFAPFAANTRKVYRSTLRGFLTYLYSEHHVLPRDLAPLVVGRREYAQAKPPQFLRPQEVQKLLASLKIGTASDIRTYALVHLAYTMGLRHKEICQISLGDILFGRQLLTLRDRKGNNPIELPIPKHTVKAIAAYTIAARPESKCRTLFLTLRPPYQPLQSHTVSYHIKKMMLKVGIDAKPYSLRHTYAQNMLEAGATIFEIKEMLGHDKIEATRKYLHVHTKLMRKVLFDETL